MDNKTVVFNPQQEIQLLKAEIAALKVEIANLKIQGQPWPFLPPNHYGPTPPFCTSPILPADWLKPFSTCENKENKLD